MEIGQKTGITGMGPSTSDAAGSSALGKDEFVKLLMAQMQNQDPTSPQDSEAFVAQLAQFAQVELAQAQSARLEAILVAQAAGNQLGAAQLVGKDVTTLGDSISVANGDATASEIQLGNSAAKVTVSVKNAEGEEVAKVQLGPQPAGTVGFVWDGKTADGTAPDGEYTMSVVAIDSSGNSVDTTLLERGRVEGVTYDEGVPALFVNGKKIPLADVVGVYSPGATTPTVVDALVDDAPVGNSTSSPGTAETSGGRSGPGPFVADATLGAQQTLEATESSLHDFLVRYGNDKQMTTPFYRRRP